MVSLSVSVNPPSIKFWLSQLNFMKLVIVTDMSINRKQLGKHIPKEYALNNRMTSIAR